MRQSSIDAIIAGSVSVANWCAVLGALDAAADYIGAHDGLAYELLCEHIESLPLTLESTPLVTCLLCGKLTEHRQWMQNYCEPCRSLAGSDNVRS